MDAHVNWPAEFSTVIRCTRCTTSICKNLLRDSEENVPQPGFIGSRYADKRVLLVGQNPAITKSDRALIADKPYTAALRKLRDNPTGANFMALLTITEGFMPSWRVHQDYFPLRESGLALGDLAYLNIVRCRTASFNQRRKLDDAPPNQNVINNCVDNHFDRWVSLLAPRVIVFIGKFAHDHAHHIAAARGIPYDYLNRERSLDSTSRNLDKFRVSKLIREIVG